MNDMHTGLPAHRDALIEDLKFLVEDAQALLKDIANEAAGLSAMNRARVASRIEALGKRLDTLRAKALQRSGQLTEATDRYVHAHPWRCLGAVAIMAAAAGALSTLVGTRR